MGETLMKDEELEYIGSYVKTHLPEWLQDTVVRRSLSVISAEQTGQIIRLEEGIKHQGELLEKLIHQIDKRFEQADKRMEQLAEQMDKRFEQVDKRFEQVDKRFNQMFAFVTTIFVVLGAMMSVYQFLG